MDKVQLEDGKTIPASQYGQNVELVAIGELSATEQEMIEKAKVCTNKKFNRFFYLLINSSEFRQRRITCIWLKVGYRNWGARVNGGAFLHFTTNWQLVTKQFFWRTLANLV